MFNYIKKKFIADYKDTSDIEVRFKYGIVSGIIGFISNILLCLLKIIIGVLSGSISIIADAINNLSDAGSSIITIVGFKLSNRPADAEHPYGHARYEYVAGLIVALAVFIIGVFLGKSSIVKIVKPTTMDYSAITYIVLVVAILIKAWQGAMYKNFGKSINSKALMANSVDSRNDVITTSAVLISTIVTHTTSVNIDGYTGLLVSIFIVISSLMLIKDMLNPLIGTVPDKELVESIIKKVKQYDDVLGYHDLIIHSYGPAICFASMHIEVSDEGDVMELHDMIDNIERDFMLDMNIHMVIHMDPIAINDEETNSLKELIINILTQRDNKLSLHDFRLVKGKTHTNVLFDVVIPFTSKVTIKEIKSLLNEKIQTDKTYFYIITVNKSFI